MRAVLYSESLRLWCVYVCCMCVSLFALGILGMSIDARGCACVCLCLMSLIIGHRPDSHQVLS